ncbi:MAG: ribosome recycling factor [Leptospirales bacterium]
MEVHEEVELILSDAEERMEKTNNELINALGLIRSGRATTGLVDDIRVEAYGDVLPLNQVGAISIPEARTITIDVWDKAISQDVEKAIQKSGRNLNPQNDGGFIRINLPDLTEDRRKDLAKLAKQKAEDFKVAIRNIRRDANDSLKRLKNEGISEDEMRTNQDKVQSLTDGRIRKMDDLCSAKEKEIMTV